VNTVLTPWAGDLGDPVALALVVGPRAAGNPIALAVGPKAAGENKCSASHPSDLRDLPSPSAPGCWLLVAGFVFRVSCLVS
jgi:hypothetical protein